ncbi:MAG TPA: fumarylacetoacetate hydrolase family protein [Alphaproteobacteria bacterium]|nr:fumarylacetoacetate hydrolase family protein [Alphaproteobacteria bacterium]
MMNAAHLNEVAVRLRQAQERCQPCEPVASRLPIGDLAAAYAVQDLNTAYWQSRGRRLVGRKIGLTSAVVQVQLGVDQPDYGMLFADMAFVDGDDLQAAAVLQPRLEAEVALVLEDDLRHERHTPADIVSSVAYALPALEVVGCRIANWNISIVDTIADNASSGQFVLGSVPRRLDDFDHSLCGMTLMKEGQPVSTGVGRACLGNPINAARWLADTMVRVGRPLVAGDIIMTGALGPMVPVAPGDAFEARIHGLGAVRAAFH